MDDIRYLNMKKAGEYIGQTYRWMQRHYVDLLREGVIAYRVPRDAEKGRLLFLKSSLEQYLKECQIR